MGKSLTISYCDSIFFSNFDFGELKLQLSYLELVTGIGIGLETGIR